MAFYSGNFSDFDSLRGSVSAALQLEGWSYNGDGVFTKGSMFFKLTATATQLLFQAGTGSASGPLPGAAPNGVKIMSYTGNPMVFPAQYDLHINSNPDEVFLVVNYNADRYQQLSWGASNVQQIGGTGMWFSGSFHEAAAQAQTGLVYTSADANSIGFGWSGQGCGLFAEVQTSPNGCSFIHTGLDSVGWKRVGQAEGTLLASPDPVAALLQALPSMYNQNTVLLPLAVVQRRLLQGQTVVVDMANARLCRNDNHLSGEIVEYGPDRWKMYPFHRKNADQRNGVPWTTGANHSGTFAYAIRYTGP